MPEAFGGETAESYYDEGLTAAVKGDLNKAVAFFQKAIRLDNTMATAYHQLGRCYSRLGQHKKAISLLSQVVQKRPDLVAARLDLGHALCGLGELEGARRQFEAVINADATNTKALLGLSEVDSVGGNWERALLFAQRAELAGGNNYTALFQVGRAAKHMGQADLSVRTLTRADKLIEKYLETNPEKPEGHYLRGEVASAMENNVAALQHYREAERFAQPDRGYLAYGESFRLADVLVKQAQCIMRLGRAKEARAIADRVAALDPEHPALTALKAE